jgi:Tfp pilus assembly protein PilO
MKRSVRPSSWIVTVPLAAAAVAYLGLSFLPGRRATGEARQQITRKQDYVVQAGSLARVLRTAEAELRKTRAYNTAWKERTPAERELPGTYGKIHEQAKAAGVTVTRFDPESAVRYEMISQIPIRMGCVGSFEGISRFLDGLENLRLAIWIKELVLARSGQDGKAVSCELVLAVFSDNSENYDYVGKSE